MPRTTQSHHAASRLDKALEKINYSSSPQSRFICEVLIHRSYENLENLMRGQPLPEGPLRIVSVGCGFGLEVAALSAFFGKGVKWSYIGIDNDPQAVRNSKKAFSGFSNVKFIEGDISKPEEMNKILQGEPIDMVILRHPYLLSYDLKTKRAFTDFITQELPKYISPRAIFYVSVYERLERWVLEGLKINGLSLFDRRICKVIDNSNKDRIMVNGKSFIPERYAFLTWLDNPELQKTKGQGGLCSCRGLFKVALVGATAAAAYYLACTNDETPTLGS